MLVRVRHSTALAVTLVDFAGLVSRADFAALDEAMAAAADQERLADQLLLFAPLTAFDPDAAEGFSAYAKTLVEHQVAAVAVSFALIGSDLGAKAALDAWARQFPPGKACRIVASAFGDWKAAAAWTGLDEAGIAAIADAQDFRVLYRTA
ncbi:MAG: hypothetical protein ABUL73_00830 [Alphaproteobacteria bacterium]